MAKRLHARMTGSGRGRVVPLAALACTVALLGACSDDGSGTGAGAGDAGARDDARLPDIDGSADVDPIVVRPLGGGPDRPAGYATAPGIEACSTADLNARVDFDMRDYYVYASMVPDVSPAEFESPEELIRALRVEPDIFSSVSDLSDFEAQTEGRQAGFGFVLLEDDGGTPRFRTVIGGSPAEAAGLERGDALLAIGGESAAELGAEGIVADLRDAEAGDALSFTVQAVDGPERIVEVTKADYTIDTVAGASVLENAAGTRVAYLPVLQFASTTADAIDSAFDFFADEGVDGLVLDVRYNPGGLIFAANRLAAHIAGDAVAGGTFVRYLYNERYARDSNEDVAYEDVGSTLDLDRVVIIATGASASASELAINGLKPYIDVRTVGETTFGKAFGSRPVPYCDKAINAMLFITANADSVTVAGGIPADCAVEDTFLYPQGDADDALTGAALQLLSDDTCASDVQASAGTSIAADAKRARATTSGAGVLWNEMPVAPAAID